MLVSNDNKTRLFCLYHMHSSSSDYTFLFVQQYDKTKELVYNGQPCTHSLHMYATWVRYDTMQIVCARRTEICPIAVMTIPHITHAGWQRWLVNKLETLETQLSHPLHIHTACCIGFQKAATCRQKPKHQPQQSTQPHLASQQPKVWFGGDWLDEIGTHT